MFKQVLRGIALLSLFAMALGACAPAPTAAPAPAATQAPAPTTAPAAAVPTTPQLLLLQLLQPPTEELLLSINGAPTLTSFSSPVGRPVVCLL